MERSTRSFPCKCVFFFYLVMTIFYPCDSYDTRCDLAWSRTWSVYITTSELSLTVDQVLSEEFADEGVIYEDAFPCDPALFFYNSSLTNMTTLNRGETFDWDTVPAHLTMLNVTCAQTGDDIAQTIEPNNYRELQSLGVRCNIGNPPRDFLYGLRNLMILDLTANNITILSKEVFDHVTQLLIVVLNDNPIIQYESGVFCGLNSLYSLNLQNTFSQYPVDLFSNVSAPACDRYGYTQILRISKNQFHSLPSFALTNFFNLGNELQLAGCGISSVEDTAFVGLTYMKFLFLSDNDIYSISAAMMDPLVNLQDLHLANNSLRELSISHFTKNAKLRVLELQHNQIHSVLGLNDHSLSELVYLDLSHNHITTLLGDGFQAFPLLTYMYLQDNNISDINHYSFGEAIHTLNLRNNSVFGWSVNAFSNLPYLNTLDLSGNLLDNIEPSFLNSSSSLTILHLNGNRLETILSDTLIASRTAVLSVVSLHDNPWRCDCQLEPLREWILEFSQKVEKPEGVVCATPSAMAGLPLSSSGGLCKEAISGGIIAMSAALVFVLILLVLLMAGYYFRGEIAVLLFAKYGFRFKSHSSSEGEREYDAFVSHSSDDVQFVIKKLMPKLESEHSFKLCVHFRDFLVGEPIADNITRAIDTSRRTIILLSHNFLHSEWCKYEFQMAHHQLLSEGGRKVILVLMDDCDPSEMDRQLKSYIKTHTYLRIDDKLFWKKLIYALPDVKNKPETLNMPATFHQHVPV